jgi:hypothetical protein
MHEAQSSVEGLPVQETRRASSPSLAASFARSTSFCCRVHVIIRHGIQSKLLFYPFNFRGRCANDSLYVFKGVVMPLGAWCHAEEAEAQWSTRERNRRRDVLVSKC